MAPELLTPTSPAVTPAVIEIDHAVGQMAYLFNRTRRHERVKGASQVPLERAGMVVLRQLDESGPMRPGALAVLLQVESPHVTRQVQLLERIGYAIRVPDPDDRRAQLIDLTEAGRQAAERIRQVSRAAVQEALADWAPDELRTLGVLLRRMMDDFIAHSSGEVDEE
jgi:DNA-binding MarR family transcriptional regulator